MNFLEEMTIEELVVLNNDIQKVLKAKRKERVFSEEKFGDVKIEINRSKNNEIKSCRLKIKQRYDRDSYVTILDSPASDFGNNAKTLLDSMSFAYSHFLNELYREKKK